MESGFLIAAVILFVFSTLVLTILLVLQRNSNLKPEEFSETIENIYKKREEELRIKISFPGLVCRMEWIDHSVNPN